MYLRPVAAVRGRGRALLRGLQQRHPVADLPRRHRPGDVPPALVRRPTRRSTAGSPRPSARSPPRARTVWVHDYQLQLVPAMVRELRPDVRIGWFNHIPFPPVELFAQLPWRRAVLEGLLGADFLGLPAGRRRPELRPRLPPAARACRPRATRSRSHAPDGQRARVRASAVPDLDRLRRARGARQAARDASQRAKEIRESLGNPEHPAARRRPARLHQGHRPPDQGVRRAARGGPGRPAERGVRPGGHPEPRARRGLPRAARRRSRATVGRINGEHSRHRRRRPSSTSTTPTRGRRWRRSSWPPTSCS